MKRYLFFLLIPVILQAQVRKDHVLHFGAGMVAGGVGAFAASEISGGSRGWTFAGAVAGGLLAGLAKEAVDAGKADNRWDNTDLAATALGGVTIGVTIDLFTTRSRRKRPKGKAFLYSPAHQDSESLPAVSFPIVTERGPR